TEKGAIVIELDRDRAPGNTRALADLARSGFYDGLVFHRVVPDFVAQGGDPRGDGWGGPGFTLRCEVSPILYERGTVGMALAWKVGTRWLAMSSKAWKWSTRSCRATGSRRPG